MTPVFCADVLGKRVQIEAPEELTAAQREELLAAWSGAIIDDADHDLTVAFGSADDFDRSMERLTIDVTLAALAAVSGDALMFHAAGVADERGQVAAFVGPSGRGKTTLSRRLGEHYGYVSDETIAVRPDLSVTPYRKPLSIVREGMPKRQISPVDAGLRDLPDTHLTLTALVVIERDPEQDEVRIETLSLFEALPLLVTQMSYLRDQKAPLQAMAALADAVGGVLRLRYAESIDVPERMPEIFNHEKHVRSWQPVARTTHDGPYLSDAVTDAITSDGALAVMSNETLRVLDGIAPVVWLQASEGRDLDAITEAVVAEFGAPPEGDARDLVFAAIDELIEAGVLARR